MKKLNKIFIVFLAFYLCFLCSCSGKAADNKAQQTVVNAQMAIKNFDGMESCIELTVNSDDYSGVWVDLLELNNYETYSTVHVDFDFYILGDITVYSEVKTVDYSKQITDSGFQQGVWHKVNFDTTVYERNGKKCIFIGVLNGGNSKLYIANVKASSDVYTLKNCFEGDILWQLEPSTNVQMEGYVWATQEGKIVVFDGGDSVDAKSLLNLIRCYKNEVDGWFISHFHSDHVGALISILNNEDIFIKNLYYDFTVEDELPSSDAEFDFTEKLNTAISENRGKIGNVVTTKKGDEFTFDRLTVRVLNDAYFGSTTNLGNDSTVVFKVETAGKSVLFLGDLAQYGDVLIQDEYFLNEAKSCEIVQMAHHGQNGVNDEFYRQLTEMKVCLFPAPAWLFNCDALGNGINSSPEYKSLKTRALVRGLGVRYVFSSEYGRVKLG